MNLLYEGKAKKIFQDQDHLVMEFKDSLTAFNAEKRGSFPGKGQLNRDIASFLFRELERAGVQTHWKKDEGPNRMWVTPLRMIPMEVVVRNVWAGSLAKRLGRPEGDDLSQPLIELYLKDDRLGDPLLSENHIELLGLCKSHQVREMQAQALRVNTALTNIFSAVQVRLVDFKIEFGLDHENQIVLGDEISPDSCRLWDRRTSEKLDKDRFRRDLGGVDEAYLEIWRRLQNLASAPVKGD